MGWVSFWLIKPSDCPNPNPFELSSWLQVDILNSINKWVGFDWVYTCYPPIPPDHRPIEVALAPWPIYPFSHNGGSLFLHQKHSASIDLSAPFMFVTIRATMHAGQCKFSFLLFFLYFSWQGHSWYLNSSTHKSVPSCQDPFPSLKDGKRVARTRVEFCVLGLDWIGWISSPTLVQSQPNQICT